jgi:5-methylcytosine-specific restriction endonuclease McrA
MQQELFQSTLRFPEIQTGSAFYLTEQWKRLRYSALLKTAGKCQCCGSRPSRGNPLHVDHIKPRSRYPWLALDPDNLQVLCADCNLGKSNRDCTNWRDFDVIYLDQRRPP